MDNKVTATETKVKEILEGIVSPLFDRVNSKMDEINKEIDEKIREAVKTETKAPVITDGTPRLEKDPNAGFKALWHFCSDVAKADKFGNVSKELADWKSLYKAAGTGMEEGSNEFGGWLIPTGLANSIIQPVMVENLIMQRCRKIPMTTPYLELPAVDGYDLSSGLVYGGITWYWTDELEGMTESRAKLAKVRLELKKLTGLAFASDEILADSPVSMEGLLQDGFRSGLNFQFNKVFLGGNGAGQPLGVLNSPALVSISQETGQGTSSIWFENIINMYSRSFNPSTSTWMANISCLPALSAMNIAVGTGGIPVWMPAGGISGTPYPTLYGLPLVWCDHCSDVGTVGDIVLVDWSQYYVGQKAGNDVSAFDTSIHLKFDYAQTAFRFQVRVAGTPIWKTYFTPPVATTKTRSPYVALATRT